MILGLIINGVKYKPEDLVFDDFLRYSLLYDKHRPIYQNRFPTVTTLGSIRFFCVRRTWFEYNLPIYVWLENWYILRRGDIFSRGYLDFLHEAERELLVMNRLEFDNIATVLYGYIDGYDYDTKTLIEVKSSTWLVKNREELLDKRPWWLYQIQLYNRMAQVSGYIVKKIKLVQLSMDDYIILTDKDVPEFTTLNENWVYEDIKTFVNEVISDEMPDVYTTLKGKGKGQDWICRYCPYRLYCEYGLRDVWNTYEATGFKVKPKVAGVSEYDMPIDIEREYNMYKAGELPLSVR